MARKDDTIENRVYLFESLASSYVAAASDLLGSEDDAGRQRVRRALAELAYVSCVVADTGHLSPEQVRDRVLGVSSPASEPEKTRSADGAKASKKRK